MTGRRVLKADKPAPGSFADNNGGCNKYMANPGDVAQLPGDDIQGVALVKLLPVTVKLDTKDVIGKLQQVAAKLQHAKKLNDQLQAQYQAGSTTWHHCESIDDTLHEIAVLLGE